MAFDQQRFNRQIGVESGHRQFDSSGRVLRSPKDAVGIAQVLPTTGPEAARYAGVAWDPKRLESDAQYNLLLGTAYQKRMHELFPDDDRKATAAYNAGPQGVKRAIRKAQTAGDSNWERYLPKETQKYLGNIFGGSSVSDAENRGRSAFSRVAERVKAMDDQGNVSVGSPDDSPIINPFTVGPELRDRAANVESELRGQAAFLDRQEQVMGEVQDVRRERLERSVAEKRTVLDSVQEGNRMLMDNVKPLLARQQQVSDRLAQLATMNPLERGLRGVFDLNFNEKYLKEVNQDLLAAIQDQGTRYQFVTSLQESYMNQLNAESENEGLLENLSVQELDEDGKMAAQGLNAAITSFGALNQQVESNREVIRAQILSRDNYLSGLTSTQVNSLLEEAKNNPDRKIMVDGMSIGAGELEARSMQNEQQELALANQRAATKINDIQLADANARRLVSTMTESQLREAAANNGVWQGVQLPSDAITQGLHNYAQRGQLMANSILNEGNTASAKNAIQSGLSYVRSTRDKMRQFGKIPPEMNRYTVALGQRMAQLSDQLAVAIKSGQGDTVGAAIVQEANEIAAAYDKQLSQLATRYAGGSPLGTQVMTAYFRGEPIGSNEGIALMQEYVRQGGLPTAMRTSPTFRTMYNAVNQATAEVDNSIRAGAKMSAAQRQQMIVNRVQELGPGKVNSSNMQQMFVMIPDIAKSLGHEFAGVSRDELLMAQQRGSRDAYTKIGGKLGISGDDAAKLFGGTWQAPKDMDPAKAAELRAASKDKNIIGELLRAERESFLIALDQGPSARSDFRPSRALIDLMSSNGFQQQVSRFQDTQKNFSFGDALAASMGDGNLVQTANDYAGSLRTIANDIDIRSYGESRGKRLQYNLQPEARTAAILGHMEDLTQAEEQQLLGVLRKTIPNMRGSSMMEVSTANKSVRDFIVNNKFKDPSLERIRKIAAQNWDTTAKSLDRAMDRLDLQSHGIVGGIAAGLIYGDE